MLDSGATNIVREAKENDNFKGAVTIEVEVAFESEATAELYINPEGTIIRPDGQQRPWFQ